VESKGVNASEHARTAKLVAIARNQRASLANQHAAFAEIVEQWQSLVFGLAFERMRDSDDAEDVAQESFTIAWQRLPQLQDPAAFVAWLRRIVLTQCNRRLRRPRETLVDAEPVFPESPPSDYGTLLAAAIATLSEGERRATVLFYFLGHSQREVAKLLKIRAGTVAKRLHSARARIRRVLPPAVRHDFVRVRPTRSFVEKVRLGLFDEYVGEYRFERRPTHIVRIVREGDALVSYGGGQRNVLAALDETALVTSHFDGEGRFGRGRDGRITHFIYYEFGKRLGKAVRIGLPVR
jgi:RNA polymerase sigma-70 factor (ECF subfamily)